jgi:hypothetical protein
MPPRACPVCGWMGEDARNGEGRCVDGDACAHRYVLGGKGRPRESRCECAQWPCPCICHHPHPPEVWLVYEDD